MNDDKKADQYFNLATDIGETSDLASEKPGEVAKLKAAYTAWNALNIEPVFAGPPGRKPKAK